MKTKPFLFLVLILAIYTICHNIPVYADGGEYKVFIPFVANNDGVQIRPTPIPDPIVYNPNKGIALVEPYLEDLDSVGAGWYYTWTPLPKPTADSRYISMSYYGLFDDNLPVDYDGFVLFLNEPNNPAPFGANITPQLAAERYAAFVQVRPQAKLVVGNVSAWSRVWMTDFLSELKTNYPDTPLPYYYGVHGYVESWITASQLNTYWSTMASYISLSLDGEPFEMWITEFADTTGDTESLNDILDVIESKSYISRFAYFTNRYDPEAAYIPDGWYDFNLINNDGSLSPMGEVYKTR